MNQAKEDLLAVVQLTGDSYQTSVICWDRLAQTGLAHFLGTKAKTQE